MKRILLTISDKITRVSISIAELADENDGNLHVVGVIPKSAWIATETLRFTGKPPSEMIEFLTATSQELILMRRRLICPIPPTQYRGRIIYDNGVHSLELTMSS